MASSIEDFGVQVVEDMRQEFNLETRKYRERQCDEGKGFILGTNGVS
jgi:hypothetical protein